MKVKAATGIKVPKENKPHDYITDAETVNVPNTAYYLRRKAEGDLIEPPINQPTKTKGQSNGQ